MTSAWHCSSTGNPHPTTIFEGRCCVTGKAEIEDGEMHAIQKRLAALRERGTSIMVIDLCVDNQNELRCLPGGPSSEREYVRQCLEEIEILWLKGCEILRMQTLSHQKIPGNVRADTLAREGLNQKPCPWTRATLIWGRTRPRTLLLEGWESKSPDDQENPFGAASTSPETPPKPSAAYAVKSHQKTLPPFTWHQAAPATTNRTRTSTPFCCVPNGTTTEKHC